MRYPLKFDIITAGKKNIAEYPGRPAEPDGSHMKGVGMTYRQKCLKVVPASFLFA